MKLFHLVLLSSMIMALIAFPSCSRGPKKPEGFPDLVPCKLVMTQGSAPVEGVVVTLLKKDDPTYRWYIGGTSDAAGIVELRTQDKFVGAPAGDFVIIGQKTEGDQSTVNDVMPKSYSALPLKMGAVETSPLKISIGTSPVEQTIDLGPKTRENFPGPPASI